jgi:hypothetical protein
MRIARTEEGGFLVRLGPDERRLLEGVLDSYPLIPPSYHRLSRGTDGTRATPDQQLLDDAVATQKAENRRRWQVALREPGRFRPAGPDHVLRLGAEELEWFLQLLNDIRVGSWLKLGRPGPGQDLPADPSRADLRHAVAMQFCGFLQSQLLQALHPPA